MEVTRFTLEQEIMNCWQVVDDLRVIIDRMAKEDGSSADVFEAITGMRALYQMKFEQLFAVFEQLIQEQKI